MSTVGSRIKSLREARHLSQKEFAENVCIKQSYLSKIEHDKETPTDMLLKLISLEYNCSWVWLQYGNDEEENQDKSPYSFDDTHYRESFRLRAIQKCSDILSVISKENSNKLSFEDLFLVLDLINYCISLKNKNLSIVIMDCFSLYCSMFYDAVRAPSYDNEKPSANLNMTLESIKDLFSQLDFGFDLFGKEKWED